ncbi:amino acid adenylation domain-containing protein/thioester reductase-like protein [Amycolatopsis sulphurea]|uniref:Amino acid adenylation domain-containing protein/thioester reductase-like protein n=1 Tax=Amycolatopsis sulphurea TaxID=76022 RepID=A0A2A9FJI5_9PSEU|nr:amino acid adenylation domain-containing protein [Amycolatopsis sulphurea]PFG50609.1 amino acid adenylation domain-containing protein/thioester reductase-like protein [Amycolatopsis sulphurea]
MNPGNRVFSTPGAHRLPFPATTEAPSANAAVRALAEVARRLDRDLALSAKTAAAQDHRGAVITVHTRTVADGIAGPVARVHVEQGWLCVEISCPPGDPWERAASAVAEMHGEILGALLADPGLDLQATAALSETTRAAVLGPLAGTIAENGPYRSVPERIHAAALSTPDAIAVYAADGTLTYREFVTRAEALATRIHGSALVPVLVSGGLALPVSWAAVMFAGAGYVPIDPGWPAQRVERVLDLLDSPLVVCTDPETVPAAHRDRAVSAPARGTGAPLGNLPGPDAICYGVYTSGTTGTPLCALNFHRSLANRLSFMDRWFGVPPGREVVLQNTRHTFDSAFWQLFWPLTTGGATVVPAAGDHLDLPQLVDLIETHEVTVTDFVPAVLNALLRLLEQRPATATRLRSLRHLVVGGEQINPRDVHRLRELLPGLRISNAYGPSEAAIGMIFHEVRAADGDDIPLGRPIDNCTAVIVDAEGRPLPPGATGEIVLGGACVGAGYHREPQRTTERFVTRPPFGRQYRTGDLGYLDPAGRFHFAGRIDDQVKIGGVRVEPGELENVSLTCPGVRQAVALAAGPAANRELVLAVTGTAGAPEVLAHLRDRLPRGSLPQRVEVVDELPLTDAGKVDRRRLGRQLEPVPAATGDPVLAILRTVLRRPHLTADEDFFATGGNSLQAISAVLELNTRFRADLGVRDLVEHPTATALHAVLAHHRPPTPVAELVATDLATLSTPAARAGSRRNTARTVLLTGASGFVGARVLHELLARTGLRVICLVRGRDDAHARQRLLATLAEYRLTHPDCLTRTTVYAGDLARPGFGLSPARWRSLVRECDLIVHSGALVNLVYDYRMHREPNVLGTAEIIRLAHEAGGIALHHISTLGVLYDHAVTHGRAVPEDIDITGVTPPTSGYSLSKWVAERLVRAATDLPSTVLRLGEVMPATDVPVPNPNAVTHLLLTAFRRLGAVPRAVLRSDYSPVDTVAAAVVAELGTPERTRARHVYCPGTVNFDELAGVTHRVSCLHFLAELRTAAAAGDVELGRLLTVLDHRGGDAADEESVRAVLENLLQDNPAYFGRMEERAGV